MQYTVERRLRKTLRFSSSMEFLRVLIEFLSQVGNDSDV